MFTKKQSYILMSALALLLLSIMLSIALSLTKTPKKVNKTDTVHLNVTPISQFPELPTGCEITNVVMLFSYRGIKITKNTLADEIPYTSTGDMEQGFWGDPKADTGYTMYPPAWRAIFIKYLSSFTDLSTAPISKLKQTLKNKKPIVAWVYLHKQPAHAILLTGYDHNYFLYNDPYTNKQAKITFKTFWKISASQGHRAMTY